MWVLSLFIGWHSTGRREWKMPRGQPWDTLQGRMSILRVSWKGPLSVGVLALLEFLEFLVLIVFPVFLVRFLFFTLQGSPSTLRARRALHRLGLERSEFRACSVEILGSSQVNVKPSLPSSAAKRGTLCFPRSDWCIQNGRKGQWHNWYLPVQVALLTSVGLGKQKLPSGASYNAQS